MQLKSILNYVERHKSFVYQEGRWIEEGGRKALEIPVEPRANSRPICSGCGRKGPGYDRLPTRRFTYVPLWGIAVYLVYA
jgi:transposase